LPSRPGRSPRPGGWRFILTRSPGAPRSRLAGISGTAAVPAVSGAGVPRLNFAKCEPVHICEMHPTHRVGEIGLDPCENWRRDCSDTTAGLGRGSAVANNRLRLVSDSEAHLRSIIATLEENRAALVESSNLEAAQILAIAILQLRMQLHGIDASELNAFCQAVQLHEADRARKADGRAAKDRPVPRRDPRWPS
jgi:hypothetical protein